MTDPIALAGSPVFAQRRAGVLLHPTSLPTGNGPGFSWSSARRFIDFLADSGFSLWQMLPVGPTTADRSPYSLLSAHAGNTDFISAEWLLQRQWLTAEEMSLARERVLAFAANHFFENLAGDEALADKFQAFLDRNASWLNDYVLFIALREEQQGRNWVEWPEPLRRHDESALATERTRLRQRLNSLMFEQFAFELQWHALREEANRRGVLLFGDLPIFVAHDSADVWAHQRLFCLDDGGQPRVVAGVPPDYFSATGQRWGNPLYNWQQMESEGFGWWLSRVQTQLHYFDLVRIDHFRGFEAYWEIPADGTAMEGRWVAAPGEALLNTLFEHDRQLPLVAENLGLITDEVEALRQRFGLPGMLVLQFAFDGSSDNPYLPHNHKVMEVVYTGTHDNDTTLGWFQSLDGQVREKVLNYFDYPEEAMPWPLISAALASVARLAIIPMQDLLALGSEHRMNRPGTVEGNWSWQFNWDQISKDMAVQLHWRLAQSARLVRGPIDGESSVKDTNYNQS